MLKSISHGIYQPSGPISALGAFGPWADMELICHAIWILACIILYILFLFQGGTLVEYDGKLRLLEIAQVPKDHVCIKIPGIQYLA
jgi:hypothetical protein